MNANNNTPIQRIEPPNWWVKMKDTNLQLMIYGKDISTCQISIEHKYVLLTKVHILTNPNYLFLDLVISKEAEPCDFEILFINNSESYKHKYSLLERDPDSANRHGFDSSDSIYLLMPDRFADGNPAIDNIKGMLEKADRSKPYGRHGGDLQGILNHLDYISKLGFTAIWLNPVLENNQPQSSYHGYAITDFYRVDPRLGTSEEFRKLSQECNERGIKMIMDMVFNHCGSNHWWMEDLPGKDWINQWDKYTPSNYRLSTISDPYVSDYDKNKSVKGWFDTTMPDLNLENRHLLKYMTQNSIWWIEYACLRGIRMDTYPYPDKFGMAKWVQRIMKEYPNFNIVGEAWITEPSKLCYWQKDFKNKDGFNSHLPTLMDFPLQSAISQAFNEEETWHSGLIKLYNILADDHLYSYPMNMIVFPDNHDEGRILHQLHNNIRKLKMALAYTVTTRGIPQIYYGTELLMNGNGLDGHANIRLDFPGGWSEDLKNAYTQEGRTKLQNHIHDYLQKLLIYRKDSEVLKHGNTKHFIPEDGIYVYFRYTERNCIMVILNNNNTGFKTLKKLRYQEILSHYQYATNIITLKSFKNFNKIKLKAKSAYIFELN